MGLEHFDIPGMVWGESWNQSPIYTKGRLVIRLNHICAIRRTVSQDLPGIHFLIYVMLSCVQLFVTLCTVAHQSPLSMGFPRQEYWSGLPFTPPGDLPDPKMEAISPITCIAGRFSICWAIGEVMPVIREGFLSKHQSEMPYMPYRSQGCRRQLEEIAGAKVPWQESACLIGGTASQHNFYLHFWHHIHGGYFPHQFSNSLHSGCVLADRKSTRLNSSH